MRLSCMVSKRPRDLYAVIQTRLNRIIEELRCSKNILVSTFVSLHTDKKRAFKLHVHFNIFEIYVLNHMMSCTILLVYFNDFADGNLMCVR